MTGVLTKEQKRSAHRARMAARRARQLARTYLVHGSYGRKVMQPPPITANLSRNHRDFGKSPGEHAAAKAGRTAQ